MFSKGSKQAPAGNSSDSARSTAKTSVPSIISSDLRINGDLICSGDVQVDGWVEGDIQSRNIVIGEGATVHGALQAETVRICGLVKGEIKGDSVVLAKTAKVTGDILHKSLAIEQGAYLEGMCKRLDAAGTPMSMAVPTIAANEAKPLTNGDASKPLAERIAAIS